MRRLASASLMIAASLLVSVATQAETMDPLTLTEAAATLPPNRFLWTQNEAQGPVSVLISIPDQRAYVFRGQTLIAASTVSTGRDDNPTPTGRSRSCRRKRCIGRTSMTMPPCLICSG